MSMGGGVPLGMTQQQMMQHQQMVAQQQQQMAMGGPSPHHQPPPGAIPINNMGPHSNPPGGGMIMHQQQQHPGQPQHHSQQQQQQLQLQQQQQGQDQGRMDNISKAKSLVAPIKDTLSNVLRTAASAIYANNMVDSGSKPVDFDVSRFDRTLEEFYTLCDQMEVHLKTSIECIGQSMSSQRYLQTPVSLNRMDGNLTYSQYIQVVKGQIAYAKEVHGTLAEAAQKISE